MQWNNALPGKTLSVSNEEMNAKKVKKPNSTAHDKWEKKVFILGFNGKLWSCNKYICHILTQQNVSNSCMQIKTSNILEPWLCKWKNSMFKWGCGCNMMNI